MKLLNVFKDIYNKTPRRHIIIGGVVLILVLFYINYVFYQYQQKSKAVGETVALNFTPASVTAPSGQDFTTTIKGRASVAISIRGYAFRVTFDKTKIQVKDISYRLGVVSAGLGDDNSTLASVNQNGMIKIMGEIQTATGQPMSTTQDTDVVTLTFTSNSASSTSAGIASEQTGFSMINADYTLTAVPISANTLVVNGGDNVTGTPTPTNPPGTTNTPTPTGNQENISINLKLKFQGILKKPSGVPANFLGWGVTVTVGQGSQGNLEKLENKMFTVDDSGIWQATLPLNNVSPGNNFKIFIKGPKHIQKKICDLAPDDQKVGGSYHCKSDSGGLTLTAGNNSFDFSKVILLAGDLPQQDGIVDSYDISLIRNNLGKSDADTLGLADVNLDGIVDTQDYSLLIAALSLRYDEE